MARKEPRKTSIGEAVIAVLSAVGLLLLAGHRLRTSPFAVDWAPARAGVATVLADTGPAALVTWLALGAAMLAIARFLRRRAVGWGVSESLTGAFLLLWTASYLVLLSLGPLGLHRPLVARATLAAMAVVALVRAAGAPAPPSRPRPGRLVALLAFALIAPGLLVLELASPVSPFMDVLPYVASVQKIVTFHSYDAFANDAAGVWAPTRQVGGSDAFFSWVSLIAGIPASLGITSTMLALGGFQILAVYLLGRTVGGSLTGGFAALFLLTTFVWRRTADARGTALAFPLLASGLALLLQGHRERRPDKAAVGGAGLGIAVTVNPLIGALGLVVAGLTAVVEMIDRRHGFVLFTAVFAGAVALALPQVAIGLSRVTPLWVLPVVAGLGAVVLLGVARGRGGGASRPRASVFASLVAVVPLPVLALWLHARRQSDFFTDDWHEYGMLTMLGGLGILAGAALAWRGRRRTPATVPALALLVGVAAHALADPVRFSGTLEMRSLASEVTTKMVYYWGPYWLALAAGILFTVLARRLGRTAALLMVLVLTVYPVRQVKEHLDYDAAGLSIAESIGFHFTNAARGYFSGYPDRRWVGDQHWDVVDRALRAEIAAGRIDYYTHVLHVTQSTGIEAALATGVSIDLVTPRWDPNSIWTVGGRSRGLDAVPELLAARPQYVLLEEYPRERFGGLPEYDVLATAPRLMLLRLRSTER